jgi:hypothetical protein
MGLPPPPPTGPGRQTPARASHDVPTPQLWQVVPNTPHCRSFTICTHVPLLVQQPAQFDRLHGEGRHAPFTHCSPEPH